MKKIKLNEILIGFILFYLGAQPQAKDKSVWRKSNLNILNDQDIDTQHYRGQQPSLNELYSIVEEDKRKNIIQQLGDRAATDKLSIYFPKRKSSGSGENHEDKPTKLNKSPSSENKQSIFIKQDNSPTQLAEKHSIYIKEGNNVPPSISSISSAIESARDPVYSTQKTSNKVEIDSDNVETPPTSRRVLSNYKKLETPRPLHPETLELAAQKKLINPVEQEILGDGQFDRYSLARRTRRFKRPTDYSSGTEEKSTSMTSPDSPVKSKADIEPINSIINSTESRDQLRQWEKTLKTLDSDLDKELRKSKKGGDDIKNRLGKIGRNISRISQEDVREAIRGLKPSTSDTNWDRQEFIRQVPDTLRSKNVPYDLNDEGFEETQSLVSDTPSCTDTTDSRKPKRLLSAESVETSLSDIPKKAGSTSKPSSTLHNLISKNQSSLEKSRLLRGAMPSKLSQLSSKRATSINKKTDSQTSVEKQRNVERSSSRASLRSSRSSINSVVSTNTVKRVPLKSSSSASANNSKKPLASQNSSQSKVIRQPASRSSSSGSSIGPKRNTAIKLNSNSTSFKENQLNNSAGVISAKSTRPTNNIRQSTSNNSNVTAANGRSSVARSNSRPSSSFMRPTAASATKVKGK